ncbi:MAG: hypothetical protein GY716_10360, partial [bacterium]|nr:hypothetical protein [bacterium]
WIPPNLYNLWNLDGGIDGDGDGVDIDDYERPAAEFISGTARWNVGRVLSDTDGDGFTDAFWNLAPTPVTDGVRHIVSVSIVDNSSMLNANVATRFDPLTSAGRTPADLALFGEGSDSIDPDEYNWRTGLLDSFVNTGRGILQFPSGVDAGLVYSQARLQAHWWAGDNGSDPYDAVADWTDFTAAVGVYDRPDFPTLLANPLERRLYWLYSGTRPLEASFGLTPFSLGDELELRMFNGQNYARVFSRFERALNVQDVSSNFPNADNVEYDVMRSDRWFRESSAQIGAPPQVGGLRNAQLLHDLRHRTTLFSG